MKHSRRRVLALLGSLPFALLSVASAQTLPAVVVGKSGTTGGVTISRPAAVTVAAGNQKLGPVVGPAPRSVSSPGLSNLVSRQAQLAAPQLLRPTLNVNGTLRRPMVSGPSRLAPPGITVARQPAPGSPASMRNLKPPVTVGTQSEVSAPPVRPNGGAGKWRRLPPCHSYPGVDYFPGQSVLTVDAGQFLYPSAYGYALPSRNEYNAPVNPYFPGLAYSQFAYPILYYPAGWDVPGNDLHPPTNSKATSTTGAAPDDSAEGGQPPMAAPSSDSTASRASNRAATAGGTLPSEPNSVIEAVQTELARRGYYTGAPDGVAGPVTVEAIRRFQIDLRLRPTGRVNQATLFALDLN